MAISLDAELTNIARQRIVNAGVTGRNHIIEAFVLGEGGHDPGNPSLALTPDRSVVQLPLQTFGPKLLTSSSHPTPFTAIYICDLLGSEAVGPLSNIGLIARITFSPILNDPLLNTTFLYAIANMPLQHKLSGETDGFVVTVNF